MADTFTQHTRALHERHMAEWREHADQADRERHTAVAQAVQDRDDAVAGVRFCNAHRELIRSMDYAAASGVTAPMERAIGEMRSAMDAV